MVYTAEQGVDLVKSTRQRTVHFLLPGSQTPISTRSETEDEDTATGEPAIQGWDACNEQGQLSNGLPDDNVNPVHQTLCNLSDIAIMDGANDQEWSVASPANSGSDIEANTLTQHLEDDIARAREGDLRIAQPMDGTDGEDTHLSSSFEDQGPIAKTPQSVKEDWEVSSLVEARTENVSQPYNAVIEPQRFVDENVEDVAMEAAITDTVASPINVNMNTPEPAMVSPTKTCDLHEEITAPDDTVEMTDFHDTPIDDFNAQPQPDHLNIDTPLAGNFPEQPVHQESLRQPTYVDDAQGINPFKRPLETTIKASPAKRQRIDVAPLESKIEKSASNAESSSTAISRQDEHLTITTDGEGSKIEPEHKPTSAAAPPIPISTDWSSFTVVNLRKELASRGLRRGGVKADLVQRLTEYERTQAMQVSLEEPVDSPMLVESEPESKAKDKGKGMGLEKTDEATVGIVNGLDNDKDAAAARDDNGNKVVEDLVQTLVDEVIAQDGLELAHLSTVKTLRGSHTGKRSESNATAVPCPRADVDECEWQDDSYEEVVLLTTSRLASPVGKESVQQAEMDADISLESIEAPVIETNIRDGTPPRCSGSGTLWMALEAERS